METFLSGVYLIPNERISKSDPIKVWDPDGRLFTNDEYTRFKFSSDFNTMRIA